MFKEKVAHDFMRHTTRLNNRLEITSQIGTYNFEWHQDTLILTELEESADLANTFGLNMISKNFF